MIPGALVADMADLVVRQTGPFARRSPALSDDEERQVMRFVALVLTDLLPAYAQEMEASAKGDEREMAQ